MSAAICCSGIELRIPATPAGSPCGGPPPPPSSPATALQHSTEGERVSRSKRAEAARPKDDFRNGWAIRLAVESGGLRVASNLLGQLPDSRHRRDLHDLPELAPFGDPHLSVVFPHPEWGDHAGDYDSDFHRLGIRRHPDVWRFEVRSSEVRAEATLRWEEPATVVERSILVDRATGEWLRVKPGDGYKFELTGTAREFLWILGARPSGGGRRRTPRQ